MRKIIKTATLGAAAMVAATGITVATSGAATAATSAIIMCTDPNFQGKCIQTNFLSVNDLSNPTLFGSGFNDSITSISNASGVFLCVYTDANFRGAKAFIGNNLRVDQLSGAFQDSISSFHTAASSLAC